MFRDKEEELRRLEQLLAQAEEEDEAEYEENEEYPEEEEYGEEDFDEEELIEEFSGGADEDFDTQTAQTFPTDKAYRMYNADRCDVELEQYSEDVFSGSRKPVLPWVFAALTAVVLLVLYLALKQGGYLG